MDNPVPIVALDPKPLDASDIEAIKGAKHPLLQLREEFEAAREERLNETYGYGGTFDPLTDELISFSGGPAMSVSVCHPQSLEAPVEEWAVTYWWWGDEKPMMAARRYIIARDFNEFDPQRQDMLWKLTNGGAL